MIRIGVTGTDTGVGKTVIALALVAQLRQRGIRVAAMKPVETGVTPGGITDAGLLRAAAGNVDRAEDVCPVRFAEPLAPLAAAERAGQVVQLDALDGAFARLCAGRDAIVVEGAGGLLVPLTTQLSYAGLFARWGLAVVVVAANRLGAINHVLLTVAAVRAAGLDLGGIVLNDVQPGTANDLAAGTNARTLEQLLPDVLTLRWPWLAEPADARALAACADQTGLAALYADRATPRSHLSLETHR